MACSLNLCIDRKLNADRGGRSQSTGNRQDLQPCGQNSVPFQHDYGRQPNDCGFCPSFEQPINAEDGTLAAAQVLAIGDG